MSAKTKAPVNYTRLQIGSFQGQLPTAGFKSALFHIAENSTLNLTVKGKIDIVLNIYSSPTLSETDKTLFYSKTLLTDVKFQRRFAITPAFIQIEIVNTNSVVGSVMCVAHTSVATQFDASTLLNSKIEIDANCNLTRVGNDYNVDMIREIHPDFKKVNILGLTNQQNSAEYTVGVSNYDVFQIGQTQMNLYVQNVSTNDTAAGSGCRGINIHYIDGNYEEQIAGFTMPATTGRHIVGVLALAVHRVEVITTGGQFKNDGDIFITDSTGATIFAEIPAGDNLCHGAYFIVPNNKTLIITDVNISAIGFPATMRIYEYDVGSSRVRASIGDFRLTSNYNQLVYRLNGRVDSRKMVMVNIIPDASAPTTPTNVNININGILCPAINNFPIN